MPLSHQHKLDILIVFIFVLLEKIIPGRIGGQVRLFDSGLEQRLYALRRNERKVVIQILTT